MRFDLKSKLNEFIEINNKTEDPSYIFNEEFAKNCKLRARYLKSKFNVDKIDPFMDILNKLHFQCPFCSTDKLVISLSPKITTYKPSMRHKIYYKCYVCDFCISERSGNPVKINLRHKLEDTVFNLEFVRINSQTEHKFLTAKINEIVVKDSREVKKPNLKLDIELELSKIINRTLLNKIMTKINKMLFLK